MKNISIILATLLAISCGEAPEKQTKPKTLAYRVVAGNIDDTFFVVEVDKCHYIVFDGSQKGGIIHKYNCPNHIAIK